MRIKNLFVPKRACPRPVLSLDTRAEVPDNCSYLARESNLVTLLGSPQKRDKASGPCEDNICQFLIHYYQPGLELSSGHNLST